MEIDITTLATEGDLFEFSGSIAERGANAGPETWANSKEEAAARPLLSADDELQDFRDYLRGFGAWSDEEIDAWDAVEVNALFIQYIAGDLRQAKELCPGTGPAGIDWDVYRALVEAGTCGGNVYADGEKVFASISD